MIMTIKLPNPLNLTDNQCVNIFDRYNPDDTNEAILSWGDTGGTVNALHFNTATISLFERPTATSSDKQGGYVVNNV